MNELRSNLRKCQPYFIEKDLMPQLYLKEDEKKTEHWIFKYYFCYHLPDITIAMRTDLYTRSVVTRRLNKILERNRAIIENFIKAQK